MTPHYCVNPVALILLGIIWIVLGSIFYHDECDQYSPLPGIANWLICNGSNHLFFGSTALILNKVSVKTIWKVISMCLLTISLIYLIIWTVWGTILMIMEFDYPCEDISPLVISLACSALLNYITTLMSIRIVTEEGETVDRSIDDTSYLVYS